MLPRSAEWVTLKYFTINMDRSPDYALKINGSGNPKTAWRIIMKKTISIALCEARHTMPECVTGAIYPNTVDPLDIAGITETADAFMHDHSGDVVNVYVTGLTVCTMTAPRGTTIPRPSSPKRRRRKRGMRSCTTRTTVNRLYESKHQNF